MSSFSFSSFGYLALLAIAPCLLSIAVAYVLISWRRPFHHFFAVHDIETITDGEGDQKTVWTCIVLRRFGNRTSFGKTIRRLGYEHYYASEATFPLEIGARVTLAKISGDGKIRP